MKTQYKWILIKDAIIILTAFLCISSYTQNAYVIKCWIRENLYGDANAEETLKERDNLQLVDSDLSKYKPLFLACDIVSVSEEYEVHLAYICNNGAIYQYAGTYKDFDGISLDELKRPSYLRALCEYRAKLDTPLRTVDSMAELQDAYYNTVQIQDRETFSTLLMGTNGVEQYVNIVDSMEFYMMGYLYSSGTEFITTQYYRYQDGVSQALTDEKAKEVLNYLQIFSAASESSQ